MLYFFIASLATVLSAIVLFVAYYVIGSKVLKLIVVNPNPSTQQSEIELWVISNGAHTDICVPLQNEWMDWTNFIDLSHFKSCEAKYISFGWGDKGFYFDTPTWAELKASTALKAAFKLSSTTMQVVLHEDVPQSKWTKSLKISTKQYQNVIHYIQNSFDLNEQDAIIPIEFAGLPAYEQMNYKFFEAKGKYHFLKTCNCWANNVLKVAEIKTALWTPFAKEVFYHLEKKN